MNRSASNNLPFSRCNRGLSLIVPLFLFPLLAVTPLFSQGSAPDYNPDGGLMTERSFGWRLAAAPMFGLTAHRTTLDIYYGSPGCGEFTDQVSGLTGLKVFGEFPLLRAPSFLFTGSVGLQNRPIGFVESFSQPSRYLNGVTGEVVTQQRLDASMRAIALSGGLIWEPAANLRLGAAPSLLLLSTGDVRQYEQIVTPIGASFTETDDYQRPVNRGKELEFNNLGFEVSAWGGLRLPLGNHLALIPELGVSLVTTSFEQSYQWGATTVHASIGLAWESWNEKPRQIPPPLIAALPEPPQAPPGMIGESIDTAVVDAPVDEETPSKPALEAFIRVVGIDDKGNEYPEPVIEIRESPWSRSIPLIPNLFFEAGSGKIADRYVLFRTPEEADRFHPDSLQSMTPVDLHHHLLNILGQRMRARPEVSVTVVGTTSNEERRADSTLSLHRAEAVRRYLREIWGIDARRIKVAAGEPTNPSSEETEEGRAENRRAEFVFDGESLLRPVVIERMASIASPPAIKFYPEMLYDSAIASWNITVRQGGRILLRLDSSETTVGGSASTYWPLGDLRISRDPVPIHYRFEVTDVTGQTAAAEESFRVIERVTRTPEEEESELEVKEYLLVGFIYNRAELRPEHRSEIYEIARTVQEGGWIEITGFTDRVGDVRHNRELALQRAQNVEAALQNVRNRLSLPELVVTKVSGSSESSDEVFDNNLPEGRIFSRMVRVTVNRRSAP